MSVKELITVPDDILRKKSEPLNKVDINEKKPLGTVGGLSLIKKRLSENFILSNCDTLFKIDFQV